MKVSIDTELILVNQSYKNKNDAILGCAQLFIDNGNVINEYAQDMIRRDEECSVYIGNKIAIPHGLYDSENKIKKSGICFIQVSDGVDFDSGRAYLLIGIAATNNEQVEMLSNIANIFVEVKNVDKILSAGTREEVKYLIESMIEENNE
ncbi:MAG: PTS sugar transporter subunit IIA [Coprobacillaceae bacterium]